MIDLRGAMVDGPGPDVVVPFSWAKDAREPDPSHFAMTIDVVLSLAAASAPSAPAIIWKDQTYSFSQFDAWVSRLSSALIERFGNAGTLAGARVGIHVKKEPLNVAAAFAVLRAGGILVPLNPALKPEQFGYMAANCDMAAAFVPAKIVEEMEEGMPDGNTLWCDIHTALGSLSEDSPAVLCKRQPNDTAILFYTSGSTGRPKGVMVSHHGNVLAGASVAHFLALSQSDRVLALLPLSFDYGFNQIVSTWMACGAVVLHDFFLASDVPKVVAKHQVTGMGAVPPLWHLVLDATWPAQAASSVRYLTNSGGKLSPDLQQRMRACFKGAEIFAMYGLTEAFRSTVMPPNRLAEKPESVGTPIPFARVAVAAADGTPAGDDEPGELVHAGPLVSQGYWRDPERTARRFKPVPEGLRRALGAMPGDMCVFSGDQVKRDAQGDYHFVGRLDDMIKVLGNRLSPQEVEDAVLGVDGVQTAVAFGLEDAKIGARIVVIAETSRSDHDALVAAIRQSCKVHLPGYAQPHHITCLDQLPRSPNGKIDRPALKAWASDVIKQGEGA